MANHIRQQTREAVAALLTGLVTTGSRVYQSRHRPLSEAELPALRIYCESETVENVSMTRPTVQDRMIEIRIEGVTRLTDDIDDKLDLICKEVEVVMGNNPTISGKVRDCLLQNIDLDIMPNGDKLAGVVKLSYTANAAVMSNAPDTII